jgi:hypothetical protein
MIWYQSQFRMKLLIRNGKLGWYYFFIFHFEEKSTFNFWILSIQLSSKENENDHPQVVEKIGFDAHKQTPYWKTKLFKKYQWVLKNLQFYLDMWLWNWGWCGWYLRDCGYVKKDIKKALNTTKNKENKADDFTYDTWSIPVQSLSVQVVYWFFWFDYINIGVIVIRLIELYFIWICFRLILKYRNYWAEITSYWFCFFYFCSWDINWYNLRSSNSFNRSKERREDGD